MRALQAAFSTPGTAPPQTFNMSTPIQPSQQPQPTAEAPGLNVFAGCGQPEQPAACGGRPLGLYPEKLPHPAQPGMIPTVIQPQGLLAPPNHVSPAPQVPGISESSNAPGCQAAASPFDENAGPQTPNVRPSGPYGHQPGLIRSRWELQHLRPRIALRSCAACARALGAIVQG